MFQPRIRGAHGGQARGREVAAGVKGHQKGGLFDGGKTHRAVDGVAPPGLVLGGLGDVAELSVHKAQGHGDFGLALGIDDDALLHLPGHEGFALKGAGEVEAVGKEGHGVGVVQFHLDVDGGAIEVGLGDLGPQHTEGGLLKRGAAREQQRCSHGGDEGKGTKHGELSG